MENSPSDFLRCREDLTSLDDAGMGEMYPINQEDDEYIKMLLEREDGLHAEEYPIVIPENWVRAARPEAVQYILNTRDRFGFKLHTAYLAITYLDLYLSRKKFEREDYWLVVLAALACLSLAAKMEEIHAPGLSKFPRDHPDFDNNKIKATELLVLVELGWRMKKLTPFSFAHYFVSRFCQNSSTRDIKSRAEEVILVARREEKTMNRKPSTMAAAGTLLIIDGELTREALELKINTLSLGGYLQIEDVFSLYNEMKEIMEKLKSSHSEHSLSSPPLSPLQLLVSTRAMANSRVSSARSAKRKSLTFTNGDLRSNRDPKRPS